MVIAVQMRQIVGRRERNMRMMRTFAAGLGAVVMVGARAASAEPVKASIDGGVLVGEAGGGVAVFKGVPFAAAPLGPLRWAPPQSASPWSGNRTALAYGPACPQEMTKDGAPNAGGATGPISEDCLSLNIFAPAHARGAPVMVWIYGGGNTTGMNAITAYDGSAFARDGVILVSVNYRLGALGFFAHPALTKAAAPGEPLGNYALMDQIAALKWVQRNIKAFGGDPRRVTVFGESAGGADTLSLMSIPSARGLFAQAIVESGGGWGEPKTLAVAEAAGVKSTLPADATADQLRALPVDQLIAIHGQFGPIVDGRLMHESVTQAFARGHAADVPLIIGSNSFEASLLASAHAPPAMYLSAQSAAAKAAYADEPTDQAKAYAMFTDGVMGGPARWIAGKESGGAPAWLYYFSFRRAAYKDLFPGAPHATEIPFVFDSWDKIDLRLSKGAETPEDRALTRIVHACWVAFAKTGVPTCPTPQPWPAYTPKRDQLMEFGDAVSVKTHFRKPELDAQQSSKTTLLAAN
jgi:para-nitrobenzyl esterase